MKKDSFIIHAADEEYLNDLTDEEVGKLFKAFFAYQKTKTVPDFSDRTMRLAFTAFRKHMDYDTEEYKKKCETNKQNGARGGRPKNEENRTVICETEKTERFFEKPKKPDIDIDLDMGIVSDNHTNAPAPAKRVDFVPPKRAEVESFAEERGRGDLVDIFFLHYDKRNWRNKFGKRITDWRESFLTWELRNPPKTQDDLKKPGKKRDYSREA